MPAGVSWSQYLRYTTAAMLSMFAGAQLVHIYYQPMKDIEVYIEKEKLALHRTDSTKNASNSDGKPPEGR